MTKSIARFAILAMTSLGAASARNGNEYPDIGTWHISKLLYYNSGALGEGLTRSQAQRRIGRNLVVTKNGVAAVGRESCPQRRSVTTIARAELMESYKLLPPPGQTVPLGLPENVTVFTYGCIELWMRSDGNMVANVDGYYFEMRKVTPTARSK